MNNYILIVLDSCRYDSVVSAKAPVLKGLGSLQRRYSFASWTAPSHFNLMMGIMPHTSPKYSLASESYKRDFLQYAKRLGLRELSFGAMLPSMYLPIYLSSRLGYLTHAMVSLPVLNPKTVLNQGFTSYTLMPSHNDMRAMLAKMSFEQDQPSFYLLNVGETHYPYALPHEEAMEWPHIHGVHGVFKHMGDAISDKSSQEDHKLFPTSAALREMQAKQVAAVEYIDSILEELVDTVPKNTFITILGDHGELFGEDGYFGHGPIMHPKVWEVPFVEAQIR